MVDGEKYIQEASWASSSGIMQLVGIERKNLVRNIHFWCLDIFIDCLVTVC